MAGVLAGKQMLDPFLGGITGPTGSCEEQLVWWLQCLLGRFGLTPYSW